MPSLLANAPGYVAGSRLARDASVRTIVPVILLAAAIWPPSPVGVTWSAAHSLSALLAGTVVGALVSLEAANQLNEALSKVLPVR